MTTKTLLLSRPLKTRRRSRHFVRCVWLTAGWLSIAPAETIRIASWNLTASPNSTNLIDASTIAGTLTTLDPDVILLQGVHDSNICRGVAAALKPAEYAVLVCSAFDLRPSGPEQVQEVGGKKQSLEQQIETAKLELQNAQYDLRIKRDTLGNIANELAPTDPTNWPELTPETAEEYRTLTLRIETLSEQERELRRRGYKETHPLIQDVRGQLRSFSTRRAEIDRNLPGLKFAVVGTNAPDWGIVSRISDYQRLRVRANSLQKALADLDTQLAYLLHTEAAVKDNPHGDESANDRAQIGILAKKSAYFSSADPWAGRKDEGFVFAAIQHGQRRIGFFSVRFPAQLQSTGAVEQLLGKINSIRRWEESSVQTLVIGCSFDGTPNAMPGTGSIQPLSLLARGGFSDALRDLEGSEISGHPDRTRLKLSASEYILVESTGLPLNPQKITGPPISHPLLLCDLELDPVRVAAGRLARVEDQTSNGRIQLAWRNLPSRSLWGIITLVFGLTAFWWLSKHWKGRSRRSARLLPAKVSNAGGAPSGYTVVVTPLAITGSAADSPPILPPVKPLVHLETPSTRQTQSASWEQRALAAEAQAKHAQAILQQGLLPELGRWLKHKFLRKLLVDRSQLLAAHAEATRKVMAVDARLTKLELHIQQQTQSYLQRIEELTAELAAAKEENRELIRSKIAQVKIEMESARKKILEQQSSSERT